MTTTQKTVIAIIDDLTAAADRRGAFIDLERLEQLRELVTGNMSAGIQVKTAATATS